jgi:hypothetical protein
MSLVNCQIPLTLRRCEKIGISSIPVIPAEAGIQYFQGVNPPKADWTPVFAGETTKKQFFHTF